MFIDTCSLGCNSGTGGLQVNCSIVQVSLSTEVSIVFSEPVAPSSIDSTTFQLIDVGSGDIPIGNRFVDPNNSRRIIFRPSITFDNNGTATFGFMPLRTYRITIPGTEHGDTGPFIESTSGKANMSRMQCDIQTTTTVDDLVPGPPSASLFVSLADTSTPDTTDSIPNQPASGATNVWRDSTIRFVFNDIMNPSTLANPSTQQSTLISVRVDTDGDLATVTDQVTLFGSYVVTINLNLLQTVMVFTPANGMPSSGGLPTQASPRKVIVQIPVGVQDLAGNLLSNPGTTIFTPELIEYDPISIPDADGENFSNILNRDALNSGAAWGGGKLSIGWGGGSGRLGSLRVPTLQTVELDTDGTLFKNLSTLDPVTTLPVVATTGILDNSRPNGGPAGYDALTLSTWPTATVTNGIFDFSSIVVESGGTLRIVGSQAGRLFSRGPVTIDGTIDINGETPAPHLSDDADGGLGASGGPRAGAGGQGGDRPDNSGNPDIAGLSACLILTDCGIANPGAVIDGAPGGGVGANGTLASGRGGRHFPNPFPTTTENDPAGRGGLLYTHIVIDASDTQCRVRQIASGGGGGAYAVSGGRGVPMTPDPAAENPSPPPPDLPNLPSTSARGGDAAAVGLEPPDPQSGHFKRKLEPTNLNGGSGGGGGGAHLYDTWQEGLNPTGGTCYDLDASFYGITSYKDHSACGGGGGGGALQLVSGETLRVAGSISARGGDGGSNAALEDVDRSSRASPGGGGSGGAVRLQAKVLNLDSNGVGRVDVSGGLGGVNLSPGMVMGTSISLGAGGFGGGGLMRLEDLSGGLNPPATLMTRCSEAPKLLPFNPTDLDPNTTSGPCVGLPESEDFLSVGAWDLPLRRPDSYSGAVSCWMRPTGRFFTIQFDEDDFTIPTNPVMGWNMMVLYGDPGTTPTRINYRGPDPNSPFGSGDFETNLGSTMNYVNEALPAGNQFGTGAFIPTPGGTFLAVRFQGALAIADTSSNPCNVPLSGVGSKIAPGSLTPWVRHPAELNEFLPKPNMLRFTIVFDRSGAPPGSPASRVQGITDLVINAQPD
jgi:hypothetical protein